nr:facilitated trehalose transporter Tret1-like [Onthophagus taurus]
MVEINYESNESRRKNMAQIVAVCIKNTLLVTFGMTLGYPTILIPGLEREFSATVSLISWIGSINLICVPIGGTISGMVTQAYGRKRTMQIVNIPFLCAWLLLSFATDITQVLIALCITGLTGGLLEAPVITYVAEICEPKLRGALSSTSSLSVILGILLEFLLGTFLSWKHAALANCIFPILSFTLLFFVPESPHWLILKERETEAKKSIAWLRGWVSVKNNKTVEKEFNDLKVHIESDNKKSFKDNLRLFSKKNFLWPFGVVALTFFLGHFSGMTTLQTFAVQIFLSINAPIDKYVSTVILGCAELVGCILCVFLIHKLGKRLLNFISLIGTSICFVVVATYVYLNDVNHFNQKNVNITNSMNLSLNSDTDMVYNWTPLIFLILAALLSHIGIRILPWVLTGELYSNETRAAGSGFSSAIGYIFGFLANKTFLYIVDGLTLAGTFWLNAAIGLIGCLLLYIYLPETEGKSLHEIADHFNGGIKLDNLVKKKCSRKDKLDINGMDNKGFNPVEDVKNIDVTISKL